MAQAAPNRQRLMRRITMNGLMLSSAMILTAGTFFWMTKTGSDQLNAETGQIHLLALGRVTRYITENQLWMLRAEGVLVIAAMVNNLAFILANRKELYPSHPRTS